jgi:SAM-dependent methyltransferase
MINSDISIPKTRQDYNLIASDFSTRRAVLTDDFKRLGSLVNDGDNILDFGCGDGRLLRTIGAKSFHYLGIDISDAMIQIASKLFPERTFAIIDGLNLKLTPDYFDAIFAIAVLHHLPEDSRAKTLKQLFDGLKPGGRIIATAWQANPDLISQKWMKLSNRTGDYFVTYTTKDGVAVKRYIHLYSEIELCDLFKEAGFTGIEISHSRRGKTVTNHNLEVMAIKPR